MTLALDMEPALAYLKAHNDAHPEEHITIFQLFLAAVNVVVTQRPLINYFIVNGRMYEHNKTELAFIAKRRLADDGGESVIKVALDGEDSLSTVHNRVIHPVREVKKTDSPNNADATIDTVGNLPHFLLKRFMQCMFFLDRRDWMPWDLVKVDPDHCSVFLSNLGTVGIDAPLHHLSEFGTCSLFICIGAMQQVPTLNSEGQVVMKNRINVSFSVDERVADGFYFARSTKLLEYLMLHPELLELKAKEVPFVET
jgi:hypothetical protein